MIKADVNSDILREDKTIIEVRVNDMVEDKE